MKGLCYIVLILGFFLFYQQNPVYAVAVIGIFLVVFVIFKSRKHSSGRGAFGFLSGKQSQQNNRMDDLITLMMIQQLMNSNGNRSNHQPPQEDNKEHKSYIKKVHNEIQELLEED